MLAPGLADQELVLNEEIDLYQNCLDKDDRKWTIEEENNMHKYGMQTMLDETIHDIKTGVLSNDKYHL